MVEVRSYSSPTRDEASRRTRQRILTSAERLFLRDGYAAVTMSAIAADADVTAQTVYNSVGGKSAVLKQVCDALLAGDERRLRFADLPEARGDAQADPRAVLLAFFGHGTRSSSPVAAVVGLVREGAAAGDADMRTMVAAIDRERYSAAQAVVARLASLGALRAGYDQARAADVIWTLHSPDLRADLVGVRGWTADECARWCADAAARTIMSSDQQEHPAASRARRPWLRGGR